MVVFLSESDVQATITMAATLDLLDAAFAEHARGDATLLPRVSQLLPGTAGMFRILAATVPSQQMFGLKTITGFPGRRLAGEVYFAILLFSMESGALRAVISANYLTGLRTGAASGVAARYLARKEAHTLGVVGAGVQAWFQVEAMCAVREIHTAKIFSRNRSTAETFVRRLRNELSLDAVAVESAQAAVQDADLVVAATTSSEPVIQRAWLRPGAHVSGIGANTRTKHELDAACFLGAKLVADSWEQALEESGDLRSAVESGTITPGNMYAELGDLAAGFKPGRTSETEITIFKSVGIALQDVAVAAAIFEAAQHRGLGTSLDPYEISRQVVGAP